MDKTEFSTEEQKELATKERQNIEQANEILRQKVEGLRVQNARLRRLLEEREQLLAHLREMATRLLAEDERIGREVERVLSSAP